MSTHSHTDVSLLTELMSFYVNSQSHIDVSLLTKLMSFHVNSHFAGFDRFVAWIKRCFHDLIKASVTNDTSQLQQTQTTLNTCLLFGNSNYI